MQIRQADQHMQTSLRGIAKRAKKDPNHRFGNLYRLLNEENLLWCFPQLNRKAAPGVDAVDYDDYLQKHMIGYLILFWAPAQQVK